MKRKKAVGRPKRNPYTQVTLKLPTKAHTLLTKLCKSRKKYQWEVVEQGLVKLNEEEHKDA